MESVKDLFNKAHEIKKWLIDCCGIATKNNVPISWITPLNLPVQQPYRIKAKLDTISSLIMDLELNTDPSNRPLAKSKQKSAFPPNFVHR